MHIQDLVKLSQCCAWIKKYEETEIVLKHGLPLVGNYKTLKLAKHSLLNGLADHYFLIDDKANHRKYQRQANALKWNCWR